MLAKIQMRRGTTAQWATANPILALGEPGFDTDLKFLKIGNGVSTWTNLQVATHAPMMKRYKTVDLAAPATTYTPLSSANTTVGFDTGGMSAITGVEWATIPSDGLYEVVFSVTVIATSAIGGIAAVLKTVNNDTLEADVVVSALGPISNTHNSRIEGSGIRRLTAGTKLYGRIYPTVAATVKANEQWTWLTIRRVGD